MTTTDWHSDAVKQATGWLDELLPGWAGYIDLAHLDLTNDKNCVLGQLAPYIADRPRLFRRPRHFISFNDVWRQRRRLGLPVEAGSAFLTTGYEPEWDSVIRRRQAVASGQVTPEPEPEVPEPDPQPLDPEPVAVLAHV